jgi:biotin transport system substrate-specific component
MEYSLKATHAASYIKSKVFVRDLLQVLCGSLFLALISLAKVPLYPTPMTLQTLGVFLLGLSLGGAKGAMAVVLYLIEATCGLPVLSGGKINPLWMIGPNGGFLLGFVPAAFIIGKLMQSFKKKNWLNAFVSVVAGQGVIYLCGVSWLSCFFGIKQAILVGVVPFLITMPIKALLAATLSKPIEWVKKRNWA